MLGWREIPSLMQGQYISQLLAGQTGSEGALRDLAGLLHLLGSKSSAWRSVKRWPRLDGTRAVYLLERPASSKVASTVSTRICLPVAGKGRAQH
jgi:hypothetical protein